MNDIMEEMDEAMLKMFGKTLDEMPDPDFPFTQKELAAIPQPTPEEWLSLIHIYITLPHK